MYNFDSLTLKYFYEENKEYLSGAGIQKIQQPTRCELVFHLRNKGQNKRLYININPELMHTGFIDKPFYKIPPCPPMFCMLLRKYIENSKITDVKLVPYERILEFYFNSYNELNEEKKLCLAFEFMGKHSNIILYEAENRNILGCAHNVSADKSSIREIYGGIPYIYPPVQKKQDILKTSPAYFTEEISKCTDIAEYINSGYFYFTKPISEYLITKSNNPDEMFRNMQKIVSGFSRDIYSEIYKIDSGNINDFIAKCYTSKTIENNLEKIKREHIKKISKEIDRTKKILNQKDQTAKACEYKRKGDLISTYIYKINKGDKFFQTGEEKIELDTTKTPQENAQKYYSLYKKAKNSIEITELRKKEALEEKKYLEEKLFLIKNTTNIEEIEEADDDKEEKKSGSKINILKIPYKNYEIYLGKNSKQNDYLISKIAKSDDFWFHAKDNPSCHLIIKNPNRLENLKDDALLFCAKTIKDNSTLKNSAKASIIYTKKKYLRKAQNKKPGLFIYENEKEIVV